MGHEKAFKIITSVMSDGDARMFSLACHWRSNLPKSIRGKSKQYGKRFVPKKVLVLAGQIFFLRKGTSDV